MKFSIEILETNKVIQSLVLKAMSSELKVGFLKARIHIQQDAKKIFIEAITSSPEYLSLVSGDLKGHLGVPDASSRMAEIIRVWTDSIVLTIRTPKPVGRLIKGGMVLSLIKDWQRALTSGSASFLTQKGQSLPWLEWLLLAGDSQFIVDYDVDLDLSQAQRANSRTGIGIMVNRAGARWGVPTEFSGTASDNFVTRAILASKTQIEDSIKRHIKRSL